MLAVCMNMIFLSSFMSVFVATLYYLEAHIPGTLPPPPPYCSMVIYCFKTKHKFKKNSRFSLWRGSSHKMLPQPHHVPLPYHVS